MEEYRVRAKQQFEIIDISHLEANDYNPKISDHPHIENIKRSIQQVGLLRPVAVHPKNGKGKYTIIDGQQRFTAFQQLGYTTIPIEIYEDVDEYESKQITLAFQQQVPFDEVELSHLVLEMIEANIEIPYTDVEVQELIDLAKFDFDALIQDAKPPMLPELQIDSFLVTLNFDEYQHAVFTQALDSIEENLPAEVKIVQLLIKLKQQENS